MSGETGVVVQVTGSDVRVDVNGRVAQRVLGEHQMRVGDEVVVPPTERDDLSVGRLYRSATLASAGADGIVTVDRLRIDLPSAIRLQRLEQPDVVVSKEDLIDAAAFGQTFEVYYHRRRDDSGGWSNVASWLQPA